MPAHDQIFDEIMEMAGDDGPFQKRFNYIFNAGLVFCGAMIYMNIILAMNVPEHWCYVPGREHTNLTIEQWKHLTIPRETDIRGFSSYSKCKMYNINWTIIQSWDYENWNFTDQQQEKHQYARDIVACNVYEYDKQWYERTVVSQEDWVCSKDLYQTNTFVFNRVGEVIGTFFFGQLGDTLGRKLIYYVSVFVMVGGRLMSMVTTSNFVLFSSAAIIGSLSSASIFQSPYIIGMEIAKPDNRADVAMFQCLAWTGGMCLMPLIFWWVRDWIYFFLLTTLPVLLFIFLPNYMIESPRWLANRGQLDKASIYLNRIAKINGKTINFNEKFLRNMLPANEAEKVYGMVSLFNGLRLAKNTLLLIICWVICSISYFTLVLYIAQMGGNPFLNFLFQSAVEAPAFVLGGYMGNTLGRRLTNSIAFFLAALFSIPAAFLMHDPSLELYATIFTVIVKFWIAILFFIVFLQSMETYPTCLRQTGISIGFIFSNAFGTIGPYIAYLGTKYDSRYPILILFCLFIFGGICGLFLPETLHQKLPDSIEEAKLFGADQKFWSIPRPRRRSSAVKLRTTSISKDCEELVKLQSTDCSS